jgi:F-type H+-transporting ATPase subunit epsilon
MATGALKVRVVSPAAVVFEGEAQSVILPAWDGQTGILPGHAPLVTLLGGGTLEVDLSDSGRRTFFINRGVAKVENNEVTVLSEYAAATAPTDFDAGSAWLDLEAPDLDAMSGPENPLA